MSGELILEAHDLKRFYEVSRGNFKKKAILKALNGASFALEKGKIKTGSEFSLFFPRAFFEYLKESVFPNFDLEQGDISLSRHTSSHGIAKAEDYTKVRALQMILILDQIYFYI